jgi:hypothetical protein
MSSDGPRSRMRNLDSIVQRLRAWQIHLMEDEDWDIPLSQEFLSDMDMFLDSASEVLCATFRHKWEQDSLLSGPVCRRCGATKR